MQAYLANWKKCGLLTFEILGETLYNILNSTPHVNKGRCQICTNGQNCTKTFLLEDTFWQGDKIVQRQYSTKTLLHEGKFFVR